MPKYFTILHKVAKFRHVWSHCFPLTSDAPSEGVEEKRIPLYSLSLSPMFVGVHIPWSWSSLVQGDEQPGSAQQSNMYVQHHLFWVCHQHNSLLLTPKQPPSPSTKELLRSILLKFQLHKVNPNLA